VSEHESALRDGNRAAIMFHLGGLDMYPRIASTHTDALSAINYGARSGEASTTSSTRAREFAAESTLSTKVGQAMVLIQWLV